MHFSLPSLLFCMSYLPHLHLFNNVKWRLQIIKLFITWFSPSYCNVYSLKSKYSPQNFLLKHHRSLFFSFYNIMGKLLIWAINTFSRRSNGGNTALKITVVTPKYIISNVSSCYNIKNQKPVLKFFGWTRPFKDFTNSFIAKCKKKKLFEIRYFIKLRIDFAYGNCTITPL